MKSGIGSTILKIGVIVYLAVIGIFGFMGQGQIYDIFRGLMSGTLLNICVIVFSIFAILAAAGTLLEMFGKKFKLLNTLLFIVAIVWAVYILISIILWIAGGFANPLTYLLALASTTIVCATLLIESEKFN